MISDAHDTILARARSAIVYAEEVGLRPFVFAAEVVRLSEAVAALARRLDAEAKEALDLSISDPKFAEYWTGEKKAHKQAANAAWALIGGRPAPEREPPKPIPWILKPCPTCAAPAEMRGTYTNNKPRFAVVCSFTSCPTMGEWNADASLAADQWNNRLHRGRPAEPKATP